MARIAGVDLPNDKRIEMEEQVQTRLLPRQASIPIHVSRICQRMRLRRSVTRSRTITRLRVTLREKYSLTSRDFLISVAFADVATDWDSL